MQPRRITDRRSAVAPPPASFYPLTAAGVASAPDGDAVLSWTWKYGCHERRWQMADEAVSLITLQ